MAKCLSGCECRRHTNSGNHHPTMSWKSGREPWNKGKVGVPEETSQRISESAKRRTGRVGPMRGRQHSEEAKAKIRAFALERPVTWGDKISKGKTGKTSWTDEHRANSAIAHAQSSYKPPRGSSHPNYRGAVLSYFNNGSAVLREWRRRVFERDDWTCQLCDVRGGGELNADHIIPKWLDISLVFTVANGRTLCRSCHVQTATFGGRAPRRP